MGCCCEKASYDIAGNRIRSGQSDELQGNIRRRGKHILKVFAQVLELVQVFGGEESDNVVETNIDEEDQFDWLWHPMCDVPVHVSLACIQEGEIYEYTVYAEEYEICPLNSAITIPGTEIKKTGIYFIQWKDPYTGNVYGLNFFTEQESLRFLSSCFPPTFTPDTAIRTASSRPSYTCPSPPVPVSELPLFNNISKDERDQQDSSKWEHRCSTPEQEAEEFFRVVLGPIKPLHSYKVKTKESNNIESSPSSSSIDKYLAILPKSDSISSNIDNAERPLSGSFPSPPSQFDLSGKCSTEESTDGETDGDSQLITVAVHEADSKSDHDNHSFEQNSQTNDVGSNDTEDDEDESGITCIDDVELYQRQASGPIEFNKILADIPEEDDDEDPELSSSSLSHSSRRKHLVRMDAIEYVTGSGGSKSSLAQLSESISLTGSLDFTVQDFDKLLQDLQESDLLEITQTEQKQQGLSRQSSFAGPPPGLPLTLPPGPTLSPYSSIRDMESDFDTTLTTDFKNALKRLSITSFENAILPEICLSGKVLSPRQSSSDINKNSENPKDARVLPPLNSNDSDEYPPFQRHPSFLRHHYNPPEEFSSDSGLSNMTDTEVFSQDETVFTHRQSQLLEALRAADLENKMKASSASTSPPSEKLDIHGDSNWIMASKPIYGRETSSRTNTIRKSGWLEVKVLLVRKNKKVAMKSRRKWKKYWAILKGINLLLYKWNSETLIMDDTPCDTKLDISGCLAYPVTNHMKRDHLFSLSTSIGNTYYMEAICQSAVDEWIQELHIASALATTNQTTRNEALEEIVKHISITEENIQTERRTKNMAELQLSSTPDNRASIIRQIDEFVEDIDRLNVDLYRMKCYQSSLRGVDLPNPQSILGIISKQTKTTVSKIGIFSVGSLQSVMSTRFTKPVDTRALSSRTSFKELSSATGQDYHPQHTRVFPRRKEKKSFSLFSNSTRSRRRLKFSSPVISNPLSTSATGAENDPHLLTFRQILEPDPLITGFGSVLTVELQTGQVCEVPFRIDLTVGDVILNCCKKCGLDPSDHFLLVKEDHMDSDYDATIPSEDEFINNLTFKSLAVRQKFIRTVYFDTDGERTGLVLKPDMHNLGAVTHALIGEVIHGSVVDQNGLREGDEVVLINDMAVSHMSWNKVLQIVQEPSITITVRTCRVNVPQSVRGRTTYVHLKDLVCPSPPTRGKKLSPEKLDNLIVPKPSDLTKTYSFEQEYDNGSISSTDDDDDDETDEVAPNESERVKQLIKDYSEVSKLVGIWKAYDEASFVVSDIEHAPGMTRPQRIMKCVREIITTEVEHVKMLEVLVDRYLEPMQQEKFLPRDKMSFITANIQGVVVQQKQFKGRIEVIPQVYNSNEPETIKAMLQELCGSVQVHLDTFRQYSQFYAAQYELDKLFDEFQDKQRLEQFFDARNPNQDPNFTLNNLLSKPVLRLVRYPLFFKGLRDQMDKKSEELPLLDSIISSLLKVTEYINEVQRVTESYIQLFDLLLEESKLAEFGVSVRVSQLLVHMGIMWLNAKGPGLNKSWRKGQGPETNCFVFETVLVVLCLEKTSNKRKTSKASIRESQVTTSDLLYSVILPLAQCKANNLPDSDGVTSMWQIVHKDRQLNSKPNTYIFRSKNMKEKSAILDLINLAISDQLALYGGMSGSKSPTMSSISGYGSPFRGRNNSFISQLTKTESVDSEYELTLL